LSNTILAAPTCRVTANRFIELSTLDWLFDQKELLEEEPMLSLISLGFLMNTTSLNQADHCIFMKASDSAYLIGGNTNLTLATTCERIYSAAFIRRILPMIFSLFDADMPAGMLDLEEIPEVEFSGVSTQAYTSTAETLHKNQAAMLVTEEAEYQQLNKSYGAGHPRVMEFKEQLKYRTAYVDRTEVQFKAAKAYSTRSVPPPPSQEEPAKEQPNLDQIPLGALDLEPEVIKRLDATGITDVLTLAKASPDELRKGGFDLKHSRQLIQRAQRKIKDMR
jgi:hypothetical protein